jgi:lipopolysaccharide export system protein LptC
MDVGTTDRLAVQAGARQEEMVPPPVTRLPRAVRRRGRVVRVAKYALPVVALALLSSIAAWPELSRTLERGRATWHRLTMVEDNGAMRSPHYRGFDAQNQPYMISADSADRTGPDRYDLRAPRGDLTMNNGTWLQLRARNGVYVQKVDQLDLSHNVTLYRQDGTILNTEAATADMKLGAVSSDVYTHAEGPFGTLDAEGFTLVDRGGIVQFHGPAKLVMNGAQ